MKEALPFGVLEVDIAPRAESDRAALLKALDTLATDDPDLAYAIDQESGEIKLLAMDEAHLDAKVEALKRVHGIDFRVGAPQVGYRETVERKTRVDYTHRMMSGEFARVAITLARIPHEAGHSFSNTVADGRLPADLLHAAEAGALRALQFGVIGGFPVIGVAVMLVDVTLHDTDSSPLAFETSARAAVREALQRSAVLLEPIMRIVVRTPERFVRAVARDLKSRRGEIRQEAPQGARIEVTAMVPAATLFGYGSGLHGLTEGAGSHTAQFDHYAPVQSPDDPPFRPAIGMRA